jgi:hypothetical protein
VGALRSALDELAGDDVVRRSDDELAADLQELERASRVIEAERARRIGELKRRDAHIRDGHLSVRAWLANRLGISSRVAAAHVRLARALPFMPVTAEALSGGAISIGAAAMLCAARETDVEAFARCEPALVDAAMRLSVPDLVRAIERFRALAETDAIEAEERRRFARRRLYASAILDGMIRIDGDLDPETGQVVITALSSVLDAWTRSEDRDERSPAQRRADALGEICGQYLDGADRPVVGGERPHVTVTVDLATLESIGRHRRARRRRERDGWSRSPHRMRREGEPRDHPRPIGAARRRTADTRRTGGAPARGRDPRPSVSLPRVRAAASVV